MAYSSTTGHECFPPRRLRLTIPPRRGTRVEKPKDHENTASASRARSCSMEVRHVLVFQCSGRIGASLESALFLYDAGVPHLLTP